MIVYSTQFLYEMANLSSNKTGIGYNIWISPKNANHGPRIKIYKNMPPNGTNFSISVEDSPRIVGGASFVTPKELNEIFKFILLNKQLLLDYWTGVTFDTLEVVRKIEKI